MPIYEYACQSCQHRFEVRQKISDPPISSCVKCGSAVSKLISASAIMFKGGGWYVTDYSEKMKPPSGVDSEGKPGSDGKPQTEAKPAAAASGNGGETSGGTGTPAPASTETSTSSPPSSSSSTTATTSSS